MAIDWSEFEKHEPPTMHPKEEWVRGRLKKCENCIWGHNLKDEDTIEFAFNDLENIRCLASEKWIVDVVDEDCDDLWEPYIAPSPSDLTEKEDE